MSLKNKLFNEMFKMSSAQQANTRAHSHKLSCWTQPMGQPNPWTTQHRIDVIRTES